MKTIVFSILQIFCEDLVLMQPSPFNLIGPNSATQQSVAQKTNQALLQQLFGYTFKIAVANTLASMLIVFWLAGVADLKELSLWLGAVCFVSCLRLFLYSAYKRYTDDENTHLWLHVWVGCSAIMGGVYALAFVYFTPFDQPEYIVSMGLFAVALSSGSVMLYGASAYAVISFLFPIMAVPAYFLISYGGESGLITALTMGLYSMTVLALVDNISKAFNKSILLGLQHQYERDKRTMMEQQLAELNRRDGLTGLFNRRYFEETLEAEIGRAHRNHQPLCIIMFDVDYFKEYNDFYGHVAGDTCLTNLAEIAHSLASRKGDLVARYGGEEFAIILPNIDIKGAIAFATKLQHEIQNKRLPHVATKLTTLKSVTISLGVTNLMPFTRAKPIDLIKHAETALYEAKRQGRNRVHFNENNGLNQSASL